jgi:3-oxoacyl-[acyl-carrier protein] reductase
MVEQHQELAAKVAIVAGVGRNISRAIALELAAAGAAVIVSARSNHEEAQAVPREIIDKAGRALAFLADGADVRIVDRMASAISQHFGRIDILVNNAALRVEMRFQDLSLRDWRDVLDVLDGVFNCIEAALPRLRASGIGAVVKIGGLSAHTGAPNGAHAVIAKAGFVGLTRALAYDLAADDITVNCAASRPDRNPPQTRPSRALSSPNSSAASWSAQNPRRRCRYPTFSSRSRRALRLGSDCVGAPWSLPRPQGDRGLPAAHRACRWLGCWCGTGGATRGESRR